jgi:hypothetical protein
MSAPCPFIGLELVVDDLDRAVTVFTDVIGWSLAHRGPSATVVGEMAVVTDDRVAITLLLPADRGPGNVLSDRSPRLSQLIVGADPVALDRHAEAAAELGLSVVPAGGGFFVSPESVEGALGQELAIVVTVADDD